MAADALTLGIVRLMAAMLLTIKIGNFFVFFDNDSIIYDDVSVSRNDTKIK